MLELTGRTRWLVDPGSGEPWQGNMIWEGPRTSSCYLDPPTMSPVWGHTTATPAVRAPQPSERTIRTGSRVAGCQLVIRGTGQLSGPLGPCGGAAATATGRQCEWPIWDPRAGNLVRGRPMALVGGARTAFSGAAAATGYGGRAGYYNFSADTVATPIQASHA